MGARRLNGARFLGDKGPTLREERESPCLGSPGSLRFIAKRPELLHHLQVICVRFYSRDPRHKERPCLPVLLNPNRISFVWLNWPKAGLKASDTFADSIAAFESLSSEKNKCHFTKGFFAAKVTPLNSYPYFRISGTTGFAESDFQVGKPGLSFRNRLLAALFQA